MNRFNNQSLLTQWLTMAAVWLMVCCFPLGAEATNGYYTHGLGTKNKSMAGAGTASPGEALAMAVNPAAGVLVGSRLDTAVALFSPRRSYEASDSLANGGSGAFTLGPGQVDSDSEYFAIPSISWNTRLNETSALGLSFYGRGGMNTDYKGGSATFDPDGPGPAGVMTLEGVYGAGDTGVDLSQAFIDITWSVKKGNLALGLAAVIAMQSFEARGLAAFAPYTETFARSGGTQLPAHLSNNGHDMSYGWAVKMGLIWQASDTFSLALSYQSKAAMGEFDDYADLFAQSGGFDMPSALRAGISWHYSAGMAIHLDVEEIYYTDVDSVGNSMDNLYDCPTVGGSDFESCLGGKRGAGFSWDDMTVYKLGFEWILPGLEGYTLRAGYSHANQPIGEDQLLFNILAPGVVEDHLTFGFTRQLANEQEYSLSFMYAPEKSISGNNPFDPSQNLTAKMDQWELEFSYSW